MYLEYISENTKLINNLRRLNWDTDVKEYYTKLKPNQKFDDDFYKSVKLINELAIKGYGLYNYFEDNTDDKLFMEYFMGICYDSEEFIWNQKGLMQCYYKEGLEWQRGSIINKKYRNTNIIPILSSCSGDCLIAYGLKKFYDDNTIIWLAQEQQNYASTELFTKKWSKQIDTKLNPYIFKNIKPSEDNPHRFVFGPSTWLAMATDIIEWNRRINKDIFKSYIDIGKKLWLRIGKLLNINIGLLLLIRPSLKLKYMLNNSNHVYNTTIKYNYKSAKSTLSLVNKELKKNIDDKKKINKSADYLKIFYYNQYGIMPFIDPKVIIA